MLHPVLLCGGSGTRLWPLSRQALPKQFLALTSANSLIQDTALRVRGVPDLAAPIVVCNNEHRFLVADQFQAIKITPQALILEPAQRNTAPAVALAALCALKSDPEALLLVLPSDHVVADVASFQNAIGQARELAQGGFLTTFGIVPTGPETGYGYIQQGEAISEALTGNVLTGTASATRVAQFVEKPDAARAQGFLDAGGFYWNAGIFLFSAQTYIQELEKFAPAVLEAAREALDKAQSDLDFLRVDADAFAQSPSVSIDYAVMEKTEHAAVVPVEMGWSDIGSYTALWEIQPKDECGNVGRGEVVFTDTKGCFVHAEKQLVALLGVEDLVVVATPDAILVAHKSEAQNVKSVVERLKAEGRTEHEIHRQVYRPWGSYEGVDRGDRFQVKQLIVKPGQKTSMQIHHHRSEHWVVVRGTAEVVLGDEKHLLSEDKSIYIPLGVPHRIQNVGRIPMHFIEVQSGSYLEEDDIVRIDDQYGRG